MKKFTIQNEIKNFFTQSNISFSENQLSSFKTLYEMLITFNKEYDLSRLYKTEDIIIKHFVDSIYITNVISIPSPVVDIGTGPGFPGIPLKIMNSDLEVILAEPRHKRVLFMKKVINSLNLQKVSIYPHLVTEYSYFSIKSVITRALESIDETLERVNHFLPTGGEVIFMKGPGVKDELPELTKKNQKYFELIENIPYTLPHTTYERHIVKVRKHTHYYKRIFQIMQKTDLQIGQVISSKENKIYKSLKKSLTSSGIKKTNKIIIPGKKIISEFLQDQKNTFEYVIIPDGYIEQDQDFSPIIELSNSKNKLLILKKELFNEIDTLHSKSPLLVANLPQIDKFNFSNKSTKAIMVPFQDPNNVGAVIRSGVALGVTEFILLQEAAHPFGQKAIKASAGSVFKANLCKGPSINDLENDNMLPLIILDAQGSSIQNFTFPKSFILLPGVEGTGIPDSIDGIKISVPLQNSVESLNAPVAVAIALYECNRQK